MENSKINNALASISTLANISASHCRKLEEILTAGAAQIKCGTDLEDLEALTARIHEGLDGANMAEKQARDVVTRGEQIYEAVKIFASIIGQSGWEQGIEQKRYARRIQNPETYGNIMVCVGKGGIPNDIEVVRISKIAREQTCTESAIIGEFVKQGKVLFSAYDFQKMLDMIAKGIKEGKLNLPLKNDQLPAAPPRRVSAM